MSKNYLSIHKRHGWIIESALMEVEHNISAALASAGQTDINSLLQELAEVTAALATVRKARVRCAVE